MTIAVNSANKLRRTHDNMEQPQIPCHKRRWAAHITRQKECRWIRRIVGWRLREHNRSVGRPQRRSVDDINEKAGSRWIQLAQDRAIWKQEGETYVQE